jgi:flavin reductase (DIM6/NTAB) family NADH-FMN oxidoreductase RutF
VWRAAAAGTKGVITDAFEDIVTGVNAPLYVVTAASQGERAGCLVGFATQCSMEPVRFGVWLSKLNRTYRVASCATTLVTHLLRAGDRGLAERFGGETGDDVDKFDGVEWRPGPGECPVLAGLDWFAGTLVDRFDTGDHVAFVLTPFDGACERRGIPQLTYADITNVEAGHPIDEEEA